MDTDTDFESSVYEHPSVLDIYLSTDDPRLNQAVDKIFKEVGFKGHGSLIKNQLKVLILNFIKLKQRKKNSNLRYSRRNDFWADHDRKNPNPWGISRKLDDVIDTLHQQGLLNFQKGFVNEGIKRQTRIQPSKKFVSRYITPLKLLTVKLERHKQAPLVQVHIKTPSKYTKEVHHTRYEAKGKTAIPNQLKRMKEQLKRYNGFLKGCSITLDQVPETKQAPKINFDLQKHVYRVFSDKKISQGGRMYGGWWMHEIKSYQRPFILINGNPTVELDYASQHANMLYGLALGSPMSQVLGKVDPYTLAKPDSMGSYPRSLGKAFFTRALNVRNKRNLRASLLKRFKEDLKGNNEADKQTAQECLPYVENEFDAVMAAFEKLHEPVLKPKRFLYPKIKLWGAYQFFDSQICAYVLDQMTLKGIPCLSVHDSFIVQEQHQGTLEGVMKEAYLKVDHIPDLSKCIPEIRPIKRKKTP